MMMKIKIITEITMNTNEDDNGNHDGDDGRLANSFES